MADKVKFIFQFIYEYNTFFLVFFLLMNLITFALFHSDKRKAEKNSFRIPERDLLGFSACFGALGGCLGMILFHHKTRKPKFFILLPLFAIIHLMLINLIFNWGPKGT
ncbi:MAG: DUF1294 domain-containing protein [Clostridiales bacterium]|nr:DUF1294 domain-containing protein [Clostridiales bacterium]